MTRATRNLGLGLALLPAVLAASACGGGTAEAPPPPQVVTIGPESVTRVERGEIRTGPLISGELKPEREATVRAEVGGSILEVRVEEGQPVKQGALVARIEARALDDARLSAQSAVRSAEQALDVAGREAVRTETLVKGGALADRDLDTARNAVAAAQAQLADARARLASAERQLADTIIKAPITGIVSDRPINRGDVVAPGAALVTIIDPSSMRLEASVPSEDLGAVSVGAPVVFEVRGYPGQTFEGRIARISPAADPVTRQVPIFVEIPNTGARLVAGLFAEGRVARESRQALVAPANAVNDTGARPWVLRIRGEAAERVEVTLGLRDERTERVEILSGVQAGDRLLVGAAQGISPGTPVRVRAGQAGE